MYPGFLSFRILEISCIFSFAMERRVTAVKSQKLKSHDLIVLEAFYIDSNVQPDLDVLLGMQGKNADGDYQDQKSG